MSHKKQARGVPMSHKRGYRCHVEKGPILRVLHIREEAMLFGLALLYRLPFAHFLAKPRKALL